MTQKVIFKSKAIVVSNGGKQVLHPLFFKEWFPLLNKEKVILADHFLRKEGYIQTMTKICKEKLKNIVIIGGSASGFSAAFTMLYGPATYISNNSLKRSKGEFPGAQRKTIKDCPQCCGCSAHRKLGSISCGCICKCFGFFKYEHWDHTSDLIPTHFKDANIKVLFRDKIRLFYPTLEAAKEDNYRDFNERCFQKKTGYLYSYTGLRGNAKSLYKQIVAGKEPRIKLVRAKTVTDQ